MKLHAKTQPRYSALALCVISACLLSACGGGGSNGLVRASPPPEAPPPPPPPPQLRSLTLPSAPAASVAPLPPALNDPTNPAFINYINELERTLGDQFAYDATSGDYLIRLVPASSDASLGVSTAGALTKQGDGILTVFDGRFDSGTRVEAGTLSNWDDLFSDVYIARGATLNIFGDIVGDVDNHGIFDANEPGGWYDAYYDGDIFGNYSQSPEAMMRVWFGLQGNDIATPLLTVSGTATLDGSLQFLPSGFIPAGGYLEWVIHAYGGVIGQFSSWGTDSNYPLFITGQLQYTPNDVYLLASRVSTQATMAAAAAGDRLTTTTAGNFDAALDVGDVYSTLPDGVLSATQHQFLNSAASIQNIRDYDQAVTTFDSLSGHGHAAAADALLQQATNPGSRLGTRLDSMQPGAPAGSWSAQPVTASVAAGAFSQGRTTGYDQWLNDHLLLGSSMGWSQGNLQFDRSEGRARSLSPQWNIYLRSNADNGWYAMGDLGYSRHQLDLDRSIDLGNGKRRVHSERELDVTHAYVEAGRGVSLGQGRLTPFAGVGYSALRSDGFIEQGNTGFELIAQPSRHQRINSEAGVRYARSWRWGSDRWMQLDVGARHHYMLEASDDMRAAFAGTPAAGFNLQGLSNDRSDTWLQVNLAGGGRDRWSWLLSYDNRANTQAMSLGFELGF